VNSKGLGKKTGNFQKVHRAHARRVNLSQHQMATPQPSDVTTSDGNPPAIRWRARRRQPPRPNARPRLVFFQSRTGPPHPCGGSLHLRAFYLLTRPLVINSVFDFFTTLTAGLDQLGWSSRPSATTWPDVPGSSGTFDRARTVRCARRRVGRGAGIFLPMGSHDLVVTSVRPPCRGLGWRVAGSRDARRDRPAHLGPRGQLVAVRRYQERRDQRPLRRAAVDVLPTTRCAAGRPSRSGARTRPRTAAPASACPSTGLPIRTPARRLTGTP
jgi:hypothetical protein